jgi:predicted dehydrogenase
VTGASRGVAVIGYGWMGRLHAQAYLRLRHHYPHLPAARLVGVADPEPDRRAEAVRRFGFERSVADWRELLDDPAVEAVSVTAPNHLHREIATAAAAAGRHVWVEKPVGLTAADALAVARAVRDAGVQSCVGFNYRNAPAIQQARELVAGGSLGIVTHARFRLFSDYAGHPQGALSWRFERAQGGTGVLGDLASHGVDLVRYLLGEVNEVIADTAVFIRQRPRPAGVGRHYAIAEGHPTEDVENEDYVCSMLRTATGARVVLEASRVAVGDQNNYGLEIHATKGLVRWDFRRMGELEVSTGDSYAGQPVTTVFVGAGHGEYAAFQPGAALAMSYDDLKVIEAAALFASIADGKPRGATIEDAVASAQVLEAMTQSARTGRWTPVDSFPAGAGSGE